MKLKTYVVLLVSLFLVSCSTPTQFSENNEPILLTKDNIDTYLSFNAKVTKYEQGTPDILFGYGYLNSSADFECQSIPIASGVFENVKVKLQINLDDEWHNIRDENGNLIILDEPNEDGIIWDTIHGPKFDMTIPVDGKGTTSVHYIDNDPYIAEKSQPIIKSIECVEVISGSFTPA